MINNNFPSQKSKNCNLLPYFVANLKLFSIEQSASRVVREGLDKETSIKKRALLVGACIIRI